MKTDAIVLMSGGPDSATVLEMAAQDRKCRALHINYGQINAEREWVAAKKVANHFGVNIEIAHIPGLRYLFLDKIGDAIDYNAGCWEVLPFMLGFPITLAVSYGMTVGARSVLLGVHGTDLTDHPEYRPEALEALQEGISTAVNEEIIIEAPFCGVSKAELIAFGNRAGVPYEQTWSCLLGGIVHCGECWGCARRKNAFREAEVPDPTEYQFEGRVDIANVDLTKITSRQGLLYPGRLRHTTP